MRAWAPLGRWKICPGVLLLVLAAVDSAPAAAARDLRDGWLLGPAAVAEFLAGQPLAPGGVWVVAGQGHLYGLPVLPMLALEAGLQFDAGWGQPALTVAWQTLGEGLFVESQYQAHLQLGQVPALGLAWRSEVMRTGGAESIPLQTDFRWHLDATIQGQWRPTAGTLVQARLWLPVQESGKGVWSAGPQRMVQAQGWTGAMALALAVDRNPDQTPGVAVEWNWGAASGSVGFRFDMTTGLAGPVVNWQQGRLLVRTSHLAHPRLGTTHRLQIGLGAWGASRW